MAVTPKKNRFVPKSFEFWDPNTRDAIREKNKPNKEIIPFLQHYTLSCVFVLFSAPLSFLMDWHVKGVIFIIFSSAAFIFSSYKSYLTYSTEATLKYSKEKLESKKSRADGFANNAAAVSIVLGISGIYSAHNLSEEVKNDHKLICDLYDNLHIRKSKEVINYCPRNPPLK